MPNSFPTVLVVGRTTLCADLVSDQLRVDASVMVKSCGTAEHRTVDAPTVTGSDAVLLLAGEAKEDLRVLTRDASVQQLWGAPARMGVERKAREPDVHGDRRRDLPDLGEST